MKPIMIACAVLGAALGGGSQAAVLTVDSLSAVWVNETGGSNVTGLGTNEFRWGNSSSELGNPGLRFDVMDTPAGVQTDSQFRLGEFTHINSVSNGPASASATLRINLNIGGITQDFDFIFDIDETSNIMALEECDPEQQQSATPCDDVITFPTALSSTAITVGGVDYNLLLLGFADSAAGPRLDRFVTEERTLNVTSLWAEIDTNQQADIPEPAALLAFGSGLLGFAMVARRRRQ